MSQLLPFFQVSDFDYSWIAKFVSLIVLPFADEDFAIILGGYIVVNRMMSVGAVAIGIYLGMVASDFLLYGIGVAARHAPWLRRFAVSDRVQSFADSLKRNLFEVVALCRIVPGLDLVAFVACGWTRVPLARFTMASLIVSALYLPLMLYLVVIFGDAMDDHAGLWTWPFLLAFIAVIGFVRNRIFNLGGVESSEGTAAPLEAPLRISPNSPHPILSRQSIGRLQAYARPARSLKYPMMGS